MIVEKSKIHFVLVAGFSSDNLEAIKLKKSFDKAGFGSDAISFYGEKYIDDFTDLKISDCVANVSNFINRCAEKNENVYGIGISLGGALLLEHAKWHDNLKGAASIGTPFKLKNKFWINIGLKFLPFFYFIWKRMQKIKFLRLNPLGSTKIVIDYLEIELPKKLNLIKTPVLLLHSKKDPVSDYKILPKYLSFISSEKKKITYFENGNHVIDQNPDLVVQYISDFFNVNS